MKKIMYSAVVTAALLGALLTASPASAGTIDVFGSFPTLKACQAHQTAMKSLGYHPTMACAKSALKPTYWYSATSPY
ncbi:hypothetical protein [Microbacterium sp. BF1]|uniref:hypothetical protein n=1 Tax=Microbacterium sp. BF1 TaxID=2821146 RepID=UPI001C4DFF29|nr:hypothetical protein [Microbacterium sp. BF1]